MFGPYVLPLALAHVPAASMLHLRCILLLAVGPHCLLCVVQFSTPPAQTTDGAPISLGPNGGLMVWLLAFAVMTAVILTRGRVSLSVFLCFLCHSMATHPYLQWQVLSVLILAVIKYFNMATK